MTKNNERKSRLSTFSLLTLISIYFLILVGGIVRSTGSGMGCPDWPKCFGNWVPPTSVEQLPANYKEVYSDKRAAKNQRLSKYLSALGFDNKADQILNDKSILEEADFNPTKTWIEYVNRLIGVLIGLFVIGTVVLSIGYIKTNPSVFYLALTSLILVIFQGWIGSLVVSTNLLPFMVTVHMLLALAIVALMCVLVIRANPSLTEVFSKAGKVRIALIVAMLLMLVQVVFGTQVRESIDTLAASGLSRSQWIDNLGLTFLIHRSFSWVVLLSSVYPLYLLHKHGVFNKVAIMLVAVLILSVVSGTVMAYFGVPKIAQPLHLLLGSMGFGLQFFLFLQLRNTQTSLNGI